MTPRSLRLRALPGLLLAFALVLAACASPTPTISPTDPAAPTAPAAGSAPRLETTDCQPPPEHFALLCEVYGIVIRAHVDPLDDAALAQGAALGLIEYGTVGLTVTGPTLEDAVACALPAPEFGDFCQAFLTVKTEYGRADDALLVEAAVRGMLDFGIEGDRFTRYLSPEVHRRLGAVVRHRAQPHRTAVLLGEQHPVRGGEDHPGAAQVVPFLVGKAARRLVPGHRHRPQAGVPAHPGPVRLPQRGGGEADRAAIRAEPGLPGGQPAGGKRPQPVLCFHRQHGKFSAYLYKITGKF